MTEAQTLAALFVTIQLICSFYLPASSRKSRTRVIYGTLIRAGILGTGLLALKLVSWQTGTVMAAWLCLQAVCDWRLTVSRHESRIVFIQVVLHLIALALLLPNLSGLLSSLSGLPLKNITVVISAYLLVITPASVIIASLLKRWGFGLVNETSGLQAAGKTIGYTERILTLTFILLGEYGAIGFLLAAKSIFRFGDLRENHDHKRTEYVMIGSLLSMTFTLLVGVTAQFLLGNINQI
ncbi:hypothetical protein NF212_08015 [Parasalinivibrio latis]|uniref:hypothetical protein n=1 Tax=Parasalinivibrio latis TaxID=2952610 RepID=UPI0030E00322